MPPSRAKLIAGWDEGASRYDAMTARLEPRFMRPSREWIGARASGEVLEVAIGTGANLGCVGRFDHAISLGRPEATR